MPPSIESTELREELAAAQHEIWAHWTRYFLDQGILKLDGAVIIPAEKAIRWRRQMRTPYAELTEQEKDSDREQADKILDRLRVFGIVKPTG